LIAGARRERGIQDLQRVDRQPHGRHEQAFFAAIEVVHQGRVHPGVGRDPADRCAVVAEVAEPGPGRSQDRLPGAAVPTAPPATPPARAGPPRTAGGISRTGHPRTSVLPDVRGSWKNLSSRMAGAGGALAWDRPRTPPTP